VLQFAAVTLGLVFIWSLYSAIKKEDDYQLFSVSKFLDIVKPLFWFFGPLVLLSGLFSLGGFQTQAAFTASASATCAIVAYSLANALGLTQVGRLAMLLAIVMCASNYCPNYAMREVTLGSILGLSLVTLIEMRRNKPVVEILPACAWLAGSLVPAAYNPNMIYVNGKEFLYAALSLVLLLRVFQPPFLIIDHWFVKRIALAATGGLAMFVVLVKYLQLASLSSLALLYGLGCLFAYLGDQLDRVTARDKKIDRTLARCFFVFCALCLTLYFQQFVSSLGLPAALILATGLVLAEGTFTTNLLALYLIAASIILILSKEPQFWSIDRLPEVVLMYPIVGALMILIALCVANYTAVWAPGSVKRFAWAEPLSLISLVALLTVFALPGSIAFQFLSSIINITLVISIWRDVFMPEADSPKLQGMLFGVLLVCLTCLLSNATAFLLSCGAAAVLFYAPKEKSQVAVLA
jgi:hypothetical protein